MADGDLDLGGNLQLHVDELEKNSETNLRWHKFQASQSASEADGSEPLKRHNSQLHPHHHHHLNNQDTNDPTTGSNSNSNNNQNQNQNTDRTTDAQTMMHILKSNIGTGVLAMPNAFKNVGLWLGFVLVPVIGAICIHCMNILIGCHNHLCDRFNYESLDYDQVAALALASGPRALRPLARYASVIVTAFLILTQFGFCCVYVMFVVENIQLSVLNLFQLHYSNTTYLLLVFPLIGLTSCTSNLKHLARISTLANLLQLMGLALIFYELLQYDNNDHDTDNGQQQQQQQQIAGGHVDQFVSPRLSSGLPLFFATAVYAFEGIGVVLPVIKEMRHPERIGGWNGILNVSMSFVALLYMAMGFFGYTKYGHYIQASVTMNLAESKLNELVRLMFALAIGLSYSLQFYVPWTIIWPHIDETLFYSYRPREPRNKLSILSKLGGGGGGDELSSTGGGTEFPASTGASGGADKRSSHLATARGELQQQVLESQLDHNRYPQQQHLYQQHPTPSESHHHSICSSLATSYTFSTVRPKWRQQQQQPAASINLSLSGSMAPTPHQALMQPAYNAGPFYGTLPLGAAAAAAGHKPAALGQARHRNRMEDVDGQEQDCLGVEVEWRPPPRSMRGKRKLVRYSIILVSVSFTFVAAALIPRLDLFISLVGALASSCLAIIFPAIIEVCAFWSPPASLDHQAGYHDKPQQAGGRNLAWWLRIYKNLLLTLFGLAGMLTGGWISLSQLAEAYAQPHQ